MRNVAGEVKPDSPFTNPKPGTVSLNVPTSFRMLETDDLTLKKGKETFKEQLF